MKYGSVCSGIEAASMAWHGDPLNWEPVFFSEVDAFPSSVLAHHYPTVPNYGDMTKFQEWPDHAIDLLVGGTPCQSFSVAGLRAGLADPRGNLMLTYLAIAAKYRPRWVVWENVPGVLSSNRGRDFGTFLGALGELGYGFGYRVLDAQFTRASGFPYAVPQRRRRVFVVGYLGDWRGAAAVLFNAESLRGDHPPRRQAGQIPSPSLGTGTRGYGDFELSGGLIPSTGDVAHCLNAGGMGRQDYETETMVAHTLLGKTNSSHAADQDTYVAQPIAYRTAGDGAVYEEGSITAALTTGTDPSAHVLTYPINTQIAMRHEALGEGTGMGVGSETDPSFTLQAGHSHAVAFQTGNLMRGAGAVPNGEVFPTLPASQGRGASDQDPHVMTGMAVRRLTPRECERLQGFPDDFTLVPYRGKPAADGPRYKALGNSMAVNVMRALGERIQLIDDMISRQLADEAA